MNLPLRIVVSVLVAIVVGVLAAWLLGIVAAPAIGLLSFVLAVLAGIGTFYSLPRS